MVFVRQAAVATMLVAATLWLQGAGMAILIFWARKSLARGLTALSAWRASVLMIRFTAAIIVLHISQILLWAACYRWVCLRSWESSFYFSATSYSTVGYGDVVLPPVWRLMGPVEGVTGVLMCGISVSALFAILLRLVESEDKQEFRRQSVVVEDQPREAVSVNEIG